MSTHIHRYLTPEQRAERDSAIVADYVAGLRSRQIKKKYRLAWEVVQEILKIAGVPTRKGGKRIWLNKRVRECEESKSNVLVCSKCSSSKPIDQFPSKGLVCCSCNNERIADYRDENREELNKYTREWMAAKKKKDPRYRAICAIKCRLVRVLAASGKKKSKKSVVELLGISRNEFVAHIESLMLPGMTWENRSIGVWHIDHIIPCTAFDHTCLRQVKECWHYTNLRPLWGPENLKKYNKITRDAIIGPKLPLVSELAA